MISRLVNKLHAGLYRQWFGWLAMKRPPKADPIALTNSSRVLVFSCAGIGDTLTDSVAIKALGETFPGIHIAIVVHHRRRPLVEHNPHVREIFTIRKGLLAFWSLHKKLKTAGPWDAIVHLRGNDPEPRCQSFLLGPNVTVSTPNMTQLSHLCGHTVVQPDWDQTHGVEQTLRLARYIGADTPAPTLVYTVKPEEKSALERHPEIVKLSAKPRLVLQIGGGRRASWRDWPEERWAQFIDLAASELDAAIILLGGRDNLDRAGRIRHLLHQIQVSRLARACGEDIGSIKPRISLPIFDLVGKLSLTESAALLASARAVVSTDTGIMHLAFAVGARVVALIHCNNPANRVGPYAYGQHHAVVQLERPANYRSPKDASMENIAAETVLEKVKEIWQ